MKQKQEPKIAIKKEKKEKSGFTVRITSTVILLLFLAGYCGSFILFQELHGRNISNIISDIFGYIFLILSSIILIYSSGEIGVAFFGSRKWHLITITTTLNLLYFLIPFSNGSYNFLFYDFITRKTSDYLVYVIISFTIVYLVLFVVIGLFAKNCSVNKILLFILGNVVLVFGMKGIMVMAAALSANPANTSGKFSYLTVIWLWLMVIFTDSFAYLGGSRFGKTKMAPVISPKKTWEGAYIGVSSSVGAGVIIALLLHFLAPSYQPFAFSIQQLNHEYLQIIVIILLSFVFPIVSVFGDLLYSLIKRVYGIKDYSNIIPGHGGSLDRLDAFLLVNTVGFFLVVISR